MKPTIVPVYVRHEHIDDDDVVCSKCGTFICYLTEYKKEEEYRYCHHCGKKIDWSDVLND